jgi:hypothetical protein
MTDTSVFDLGLKTFQGLTDCKFEYCGRQNKMESLHLQVIQTKFRQTTSYSELNFNK